MNALREFGNQSYCQDHSLSIIVIPEFKEDLEDSCANFLVLYWYKRRDTTPLARVMYTDYTIKPLTLELAEKILVNFEKARILETE